MHGLNRRSFLRNAGLTALAGAAAGSSNPLMAAAAGSAFQVPANGKYDFDTTYNRFGSHSTKFDQQIRVYGKGSVEVGMGIADIDFKAAPFITDALNARMKHENWGYLDMGEATPMMTEAIAAWNKKHYGIDIDPNTMVLSAGVHPGIIAALLTFSPRGSKVLLQTPTYNGFYSDLTFTQTKAEDVPLKFANGKFAMDFEEFEKRISVDTNTFILCNPQNPTGNCWSAEDLTKIGEICLRHRVIVLADEIHCDWVGKGQKYTPFSSLDNKDVVNNSITYKSASKSFSLAGMKCAWFFTTNPEIFKVTAANNRASLNTLGMISMQAAYAGGGDWMTQCASYLSDNQDFLNSYIKSNIPMIKVGNRQEATYLGWLDTTQVADRIGAKKMADEANKTAEDAAAKMGTDYSGAAAMVTRTKATPELMVEHWFAKNANVQINPGTSFGLGGQNHMRMNIGTSRKTLKAALDSMSASLKKLG